VGPANARFAQRYVSFHSANFHLATNSITLQIDAVGEPPREIAVMVKRLTSPDSTKFHSATNPAQMRQYADARMEAIQARLAEEHVDWKAPNWIPFTTNLTVDLGLGEGKRLLSLAARWQSANVEYSFGTHVWVDCTPPLITVTNPKEVETSQPVIQLQAYSDEDLKQIRYVLLNASNQVSEGEGLVNHKESDGLDFDISRSHFTCYDIPLALGTNTIFLCCTDLAGNVSTNRLIYVFTLEHDKTPPVILLDAPRNGHSLVGDTFTARGQLDDPTARVTAELSANGRTNKFEGLVERNAYFWIDHLPLGAGANTLRIIATDAAGNASSTNLIVYKGEGRLEMDPVPGEQLWQDEITVTGRVQPSNRRLLVNGVEAQVKADGTWVAHKVPNRSPNGGTAIFEMTSLPLSVAPGNASAANNPALSTKPEEVVAVSAGLGTNATTLNTGQPACGTFQLHLSGTSGRNFVLQASTNLLDWTPILTNLNSQPTFDFTDTNIARYKCRFFRVVPIP
jgi:hypothetical protein